MGVDLRNAAELMRAEPGDFGPGDQLRGMNHSPDNMVGARPSAPPGDDVPPVKARSRR